MKEMTDEELNRRLAICLGWKMHDHPDCLAKKEGWMSRDWKTWVMNPAGELVMFTAIPNFCTSLDEVAKVGRTLNRDQQREAAQNLFKILDIEHEAQFGEVAITAACLLFDTEPRHLTIALIQTLQP